MRTLFSISVGWGSAAIAVAIGACSGPSSSSLENSDGGFNLGSDASAPSNSDDAGSSGPASGSSPNGALTIVSLTATVKSITSPASATAAGGAAASSTTLVAIITDSSGLDSIAGGQVIDETGATYAPFGAGANKGTYSASVTWDLANQANPLNFKAGGLKHTLSAKFFDNAGNVATAPLELSFYCSPTVSAGACDGTCADFLVDDKNCGACGVACRADQRCNRGLGCAVTDFSVCTTGVTSCGAYCASVGQTCATNCYFAIDYDVAGVIAGDCETANIYSGEAVNLCTDLFAADDKASCCCTK